VFVDYYFFVRGCGAWCYSSHEEGEREVNYVGFQKVRWLVEVFVGSSWVYVGFRLRRNAIVKSEILERIAM